MQNNSYNLSLAIAQNKILTLKYNMKKSLPKSSRKMFRSIAEPEAQIVTIIALTTIMVILLFC